MPADFGMQDRAGLVTGGASGIGRAIAVGLGSHGASVGVLDRPGIDAEATIEEITAAGGRALAVQGDVTDAASLSAAVDRMQEAFSAPLTFGVNAAGIANAAPAASMAVEQWQHLYDVDVTGVFLSAQAQARAMLANGVPGAIVNIASMSGSIANRGLQQAHYNSAKAAVIHLSRSLAVEWAEHGIRVNALSPGYTATPMNTRPEMVDRMRLFAEQVPMQRIAEPHEMAGPAVFLLSDAASYVTGADLLVDGGHCAW